MRTEATAIAGLIVFHLDVHEDARGWFKENYNEQKQELAAFTPVQNNISFNTTKGTTRGIHAEPWDKYVSVASGRVFAAWVDLREDHEPKVVTLEITPNIAVFVPKGVGNSYQTLEDNTTYTYLVNDHYDRNFSYPALSLNHPGINWPMPLAHAIISEKDQHNPGIANAQKLKTQQTLIIGNGQLAKALLTQMPNAKQLTKQDLDLTNAEQINNLDLSQINVVINAAAFTKVDLAEDKAAEAFRINALAVELLAKKTKKHNVKLVHISSDYVFDGETQNHTEDETPSPINVYGLTKAAGDIAATLNPNHVIVRTSWVIGEGTNFINTVQNLEHPKVVNDQHGRPTFTKDLAEGINHLIKANATGTFNLTNDGPVTTWFDLAKIANPLTEPTTTANYPTKASRPKHSTLDLTKITSTNFKPRDWREALNEYLEQN